MKPRAYLLCGPSLAGKSTVARKIMGKFPATLISADVINAERGLPFGGEGLPEAVWAETLAIQVDRFHAALGQECSVIVDDTLCYRWLRDRWREEAAKAAVPHALLLLMPSQAELLARHAALLLSSERQILTRQNLLRHYSRFEWPVPEENAVLVNAHVHLGSCLKGANQ